MPYRVLFYLLLLASTRVPAQSVAPDTLAVSSTIDQVTVYLEGAQVHRTATVALPGGRTAVVLEGLSAVLDPASVQVTPVTADVLLLGVTHRLHYPELPEETAAESSIYEEIEEVLADRRRLETEAAIAKEEEAVLRANRDLTGSQTGIDAADLERGVAYHRERIAAIKRTYLAISDSLRANQQRREELQGQLAELGQSYQAPATAEVVVLLESDRAREVRLQLTYLVDNAGWVPEYDVRVDDISQPIDLRYHARVFQQTREDWTDVRLSLSTGDPTAAAEVPELRTWRLRNGGLPPVYEEAKKKPGVKGLARVSGKVVEVDGMPLIGAAVIVIGTAVGTVTDMDGNFSLELPEGAEELEVSYTGFNTKQVPIGGEKLTIVLDDNGQQLDEVVVIGYGTEQALAGRAAGVNIRRKRQRSKQDEALPPPVPTQVRRRSTTTSFDIELPYTIPADGRPRRVEIKQYAIPAEYRHFAVPKRSEVVYLSAIIRDWEQYDLLSGTLQLFFEGTYLGASRLEVEQTADSLQLSLGRDAGVVVTRRPNEDFRRRGGLFGGRKVVSRGYDIAVRNTKQQAIRLTVLDQVPISGQGNIEVEAELPPAADLDEESGLLTWRLDLPPDTERALSFGYVVRYPVNEQVYVE